MKIKLLQIGKTDEKWLQEGIEKYVLRLNHYCSFATHTMASPKSYKGQSVTDLRRKEAETLLPQLNKLDCIILLDSKGKEFTSEDFSKTLYQCIGDPSKQDLVFVIGGPYGFDQLVYDRAHSLLSLSKMTFSHQMVRLFFVEQLYRAFTILKGEPYHHA